MRDMVIIFPGSAWDDEKETEGIEAAVQAALDAADIDYMDVKATP